MSEAKQDGHVLDSLMQYYEGRLDPSTAATVKDHVETCDVCAAELKDVGSFVAMWREIGMSALLQSLPQATGGHVEEADLWYLADPAAVPIPDEFREKMRHVLGCRQCYMAFRDRRTALLESSVDPDLPDRTDNAWDHLRAIQLKLLVTYVAVRHSEEVAVRSGRVARGRLRIGLGGPRRMRMLSETGLAEAQTVEREIGSPWEFERAFGDYSFRLVITPRDFEQRTVDISLHLTRRPEHSTAADLRAELSTSDAPGTALPFVEGRVAFGTLPLRDYLISATDSEKGITIGLIEITNQPS